MASKAALVKSAHQRALIMASLRKEPCSIHTLFLILAKNKLVTQDESGEKRTYNLVYQMKANQQVEAQGPKGHHLYRLTGTSTALVPKEWETPSVRLESDAPQPAAVAIAFDRETGKLRIEVRSPITLEFSGLRP